MFAYLRLTPTSAVQPSDTISPLTIKNHRGTVVVGATLCGQAGAAAASNLWVRALINLPAGEAQNAMAVVMV